MKNIILYTILLFIVTLFGCMKEESIGQTATDHIPPGKVSNINFTNTPGGAIITYKLPEDKDISFVRAEYMRNGKLCTDHASIYNNSLIIEGFGTTNSVIVNLYTVDFSMNRSEPVTLTITPKEPFIKDIFKSLAPSVDFAGITLKWKNSVKKPVSLTLQYLENGKYIEKETYFSEAEEGEHAFRSFEDVLTHFKVFVKDKWENCSDTLSFEMTPLYEVPLDRTKYKQIKLPFDCTSTQYGAWWAAWDNCHDGDIFDLGWVTATDNNPENDNKFPVMTTFDLGTTAQLSRVKMWMRGLLEYGTGAFRKVEFYGCETMQTNKPNNYWAADDRGSWKQDWVKLGEFETFKPSGTGASVTEDDKLFAREGFEFKFDIVPKVRYVRLLVNSTWSGARNLELCEIAYWGNDKENNSEPNNE